jgi:hypothetical protein
MTAIGMGLVVATALIAGVVVAHWSGRDVEKAAGPPTASRPATTHPASTTARVAAAPVGTPQPVAPAPVAQAQPAALPSQTTIAACNQYAASTRDKTIEVVKDGAIGAAVGAVVGAASGAIVGGGSGAGKGAAIGGILGVGGGALYGVNENRKNDAHYREAYASCMRSRGYAS